MSGSIVPLPTVAATFRWKMKYAMTLNAAANATAKAELARFDGVVLNALEETEAALTVYARDLDRQTELEAGRAHAVKLAAAAHQLQAGGLEDLLVQVDPHVLLGFDPGGLLFSSQERLVEERLGLPLQQVGVDAAGIFPRRRATSGNGQTPLSAVRART